MWLCLTLPSAPRAFPAQPCPVRSTDSRGSREALPMPTCLLVWGSVWGRPVAPPLVILPPCVPTSPGRKLTHAGTAPGHLHQPSCLADTCCPAAKWPRQPTQSPRPARLETRSLALVLPPLPSIRCHRQLRPASDCSPPPPLTSRVRGPGGTSQAPCVLPAALCHPVKADPEHVPFLPNTPPEASHLNTCWLPSPSQ